MEAEQETSEKLLKLNELRQKVSALKAENDKINESITTLRLELTCRLVTVEDLINILNMVLRSNQIILELGELDRELKKLKQ